MRLPFVLKLRISQKSSQFTGPATIDIIKFRLLLTIQRDLIMNLDDPTRLNQRIGCRSDCMSGGAQPLD
ncbi:hypothetical protein BLNAU_5379 [Blattamonas nauphoetae]|uniref:Uncharacterized protein n=1 Tax=Blattamonas nauphoetae TaxID=2049346 RepID=A0ABQ9Y7A2_9EUKA|nr:hypothetical protein BLNAU_5379 [Blattamonas nauphoetae]